MTLDHLAHLRADSARFAAVLRDAPADRQVPTCPDWRTDDLLWHLARVQWFWGTIVRDAVDDPQTVRAPERPADLDRWLWRRPTDDAIEQHGDPAVLARFEALIAPGIG